MQSFVPKHADSCTTTASCSRTSRPSPPNRPSASKNTPSRSPPNAAAPSAPKTRKDELARQLAQQDGLSEGLVVVFSTRETCRTFGIAYGQGRPRLQADSRRCLVLSYYLLDPEFGLIPLKLQTWLPLTMPVSVNGHKWLARQMTRRGLGYQQGDNAFAQLGDAAAAQRLADRFGRLPWPKLLHRWARQINPLFGDLLKGAEYYWVVDQAEYATDVLFRDRAALAALYPRLLQHATRCFSAEDVLRFLGRKLTAAFAGEVLNDWKQRWPGARVKPRWMTSRGWCCASRR